MSTPTSRRYPRSVRTLLLEWAEAAVGYGSCAPVSAFPELSATATAGLGMTLNFGLVEKTIPESGCE
jgi:hypothetical protein